MNEVAQAMVEAEVQLMAQAVVEAEAQLVAQAVLVVEPGVVYQQLKLMARQLPSLAASVGYFPLFPLFGCGCCKQILTTFHFTY